MPLRSSAIGADLRAEGRNVVIQGLQIIGRFSEDIDIRVEPPPGRDVKTGRNQTKPAHIQSRREFYDWLAATIRIDGIEKVERDTDFDNKDLFSAGIRLHYKQRAEPVEGLREGILLELGFDDVTPNALQDISSWAYDYAADKVELIDNRAKGVVCYDHRYTFVEKLQTVSTKFRRQQESGESLVGFMRHYYDVYSLLQCHDVQEFIGTESYQTHKAKRFRTGDNPDIARNEAFLLSNPDTRKLYELAYVESSALYYGDIPTFEQILQAIATWIDRM